ncbi:MAG: ribosome biogenesis GTPase Der, partial [Acidimicrobiaceae bacterium]|nr:ribosome biogenesis GTPase Der [Acidimicrobiaceae bacterium]
MRSTVAIVGRPNVGKSTLMNRILGRREAIVEERPGVTRDRKEVEASWQGREFTLVDTGGWIADGDALDEKVSRQSERAIADADAVLFVVDATVGVTEDDARVATLLRSSTAPVVLVANKVDDRVHEASIWELMSLGLGEPIPVSALHGRGAGDLLDRLVAALPDDEPDEVVEEEPGERIVGVTLVGRPNVGKSTLFNRLTGEERAVIHDRPGTTRDTVDTVVETATGPVRFIDTAGMRRKARIDEQTEYYSLVRALKAVDTADVALLVIDATLGVTHQDQRLAERVDAAGCPIVVLLNKWDLCDAEQREDAMIQVGDKLHFVGEAPVLRISALSGKNVQRLWPALEETIADYRTRIP